MANTGRSAANIDYRDTAYETERRGKQGMAVDYSGVIVPAQQTPSTGAGIISRIGEHPVAATVFALIIAVAIGYIISKVRGTSTTTPTTNAPGTAQGLPTTDANGNPVYYVPTSNTFLDYNNIQSSYNPSNSTTTTVNNGQDENAHEPAPPIVPATPPPTVRYTHIGPQPLIPYGKYSGPAYNKIVTNHTVWSYNGVKYTLRLGSEGRLWGFTPWGQQVLLYSTNPGRYGPQYQPTLQSDIHPGFTVPQPPP